MKYNVVVNGICQNISFGVMNDDEKDLVLDYCELNNLSLSEVIFNDLDEILNKEWTDLCEEESIYGVIPEESKITIYDEFDKIVYTKKISEMKSYLDIQDKEDFFIKESQTNLFILKKDRGDFLDDLVDFEEKFDARRFKYILETLTMKDGTKFSCCSGFEYGDIRFFLKPTDTHYFSFKSRFIS
jgi:hypothetical protein